MAWSKSLVYTEASVSLWVALNWWVKSELNFHMCACMIRMLIMDITILWVGITFKGKLISSLFFPHHGSFVAAMVFPGYQNPFVQWFAGHLHRTLYTGNKQTNNKRVRFLQILLVEEAVKIAYLRNSVAKSVEWRQLQWVHRGLGHCPIRNIGIQCFILLGLMTIKSWCRGI